MPREADQDDLQGAGLLLQCLQQAKRLPLPDVADFRGYRC
jgi:hypothetical protein